MKVTVTEIRNMIQEALGDYLSEIDYRQRLASMPKGNKDEISIDKLMMALDGAEKSGKKAVSQQELQQIVSKSIQVAAPLGKGSPQQLAQQAGSKTGGQPLVAPMGAGNVQNPLGQRESIEISKTKLQEMINKLVEAKLVEFVDGQNPIMAKREIIALMDSTSRNFENEIIKTFKLQNPDMLSPELQRKYLEVVEGMKAELVSAAMKAVQQLIHFPRQDEGNGSLKSK